MLASDRDRAVRGRRLGREAFAANDRRRCSRMQFGDWTVAPHRISRCAVTRDDRPAQAKVSGTRQLRSVASVRGNPRQQQKLDVPRGARGYREMCLRDPQLPGRDLTFDVDPPPIDLPHTRNGKQNDVPLDVSLPDRGWDHRVLPRSARCREAVRRVTGRSRRSCSGPTAGSAWFQTLCKACGIELTPSSNDSRSGPCFYGS